MSKQIKRKTLGIDMDGVLADIELQMIYHYKQRYGVQLTREDIQGLAHEQAFPLDAETNSILYSPGFFRTAPVMEGAVEAVRELMEHFNVYIVSAAVEFPLSLHEKLEWLNEHFPFIHWRNITFCGDKSIVHTDYLIDDYCKNLNYCPGKPIMFTAHHNIRETGHIRVNSWKEVLDFFSKEIQTLTAEELN